MIPARISHRLYHVLISLFFNDWPLEDCTWYGGHVGSSHVKLSGCDYSEIGELSSVEGSWPVSGRRLDY